MLKLQETFVAIFACHTLAYYKNKQEAGATGQRRFVNLPNRCQAAEAIRTDIRERRVNERMPDRHKLGIAALDGKFAVKGRFAVAFRKIVSFQHVGNDELDESPFGLELAAM